MEGQATSLFTSGFLGANFSWWVGQIADDSTWRENYLPGKHDRTNSIPGWGRRYKVRIIGFHDKEEETVESDQLPWAQLMYPVTAGGGQTASGMTANLRQGMFVFGFFLDAEDQQTPVIMGILGNNAQTKGALKIGRTKENFAPTSGYATGKNPKKGSQAENERPPDQDKGITKPTGVTGDPKTPPPVCGTPGPAIKLNKYGLRPDIALSSIPGAVDAVRAARNKARDEGLSQAEENAATAKAALDAKDKYCQSLDSVNSPAQTGATSENVDDVHLQSAADVKKQDYYLQKVPKQDPYDLIGSSMKAMQVVLQELMKKINKVLETMNSYVDAVSRVGEGSVCEQIENLMASAADQLAKYMKPIFEKIMEFIIKQIQKAMDIPTNILFPNQRNMMGDLSEQITQLITCLFEKIIAKLSEQILSAMMGSASSLCEGADGSSSSQDFGLPPGLLNDGGSRGSDIDPNRITPNDEVNRVSMCYVENLTGDLIAANKEQIKEPFDKIIEQVGTFLTDMKNQIDLLDPNLIADSGGFPSIDGIMGDMSGALNFLNMKWSLWGCDVDPLSSISDYYTFQNGGGAGEQVDQPRLSQVGEKAAQVGTKIETRQKPDYAVPNKDTAPLRANQSKSVGSIREAQTQTSEQEVRNIQSTIA